MDGAMRGDRRVTEWAPRILFAAAVLASAAFLFHYRERIGFTSDDLTFLRDRGTGGIEALLVPHGENVVVLHAVLYRLSYGAFGIGSAVPIQAISLATFLVSVVAFFVWVRGRVGDWAALAAALPILFLGVSSDDLLWAFQIGYTGAAAAGLIALIALERDGRFARPVACVGLVVSVFTSSLGIPFLCGAAVLLFSRDRRGFWRSYVLWVPAALFVAWFIGWGSEADSRMTVANLLDAPFYVAESVKAVAEGVTGLHRIEATAGDVLGWLAAAGVTGLVAVRLVAKRRLPVPFLVALAAGLAFWVLASANQVESGVRSADQNRYMYPGAVFLLMILAGAFDGWRPRRGAVVALLALALVSVGCSLDRFGPGADLLSLGARLPKASMTAVDLAGPAADPAYQLKIAPFYNESYMSPEQLRELERRYGRAGWTENQVNELGEGDRRLVDLALVDVLGVGLAPASPPPGRSGCRRLVPGKAPGAEVARIRSGSVTLTALGDQVARVRVGRFAGDEFVPVGRVEGGATGRLSIPLDLSHRAWRVAAVGEGPVRACVGG